MHASYALGEKGKPGCGEWMMEGGLLQGEERKHERSESLSLLQDRGLASGFLGVCSPESADLRRPTGIKRPCECTIAHDISLENVSRMHELSEAFHAISLRHTCLLSILEQFSKLSSRAGMDTLKRHLPISGPEGLNELRKIVERFEEKIYSTATSQVYPSC
ncbi:hypothetical protein VitviT2T_002616 [Vitis vinifera]|uniref:Mediator complex subunit 15 KIX domain-containing protein n=1 Tax=Vitis vinifera TaxID=29760 RepID=A0ABY9BJ12_VITVI|nr:hypothetical protein VitviT2T_002616 [Vitis vinifera]